MMLRVKTVKALSIRQPWATWSVRWRIGEVRNRPICYRGPLLVHAAQRDDPKFRKTMHDRDVPRGALVGIVTVVGCERIRTPKDWRRIRKKLGEEGPRPYGKRTHVWYLEDRREFVRPIPWKGRLGLFGVPSAVVQRAKFRRKSKSRRSRV